MLTIALITFWVVAGVAVVWRLRVEKRAGIPYDPEAVRGKYQGEAEARRVVQNPGSAGGMVGGA